MITLGPLLDHLPAWLMVLFRLTGIFLLAPMFGSSSIPRLVKVMLVVGLSLCVYPMLMGTGQVATASLVGIIDASGIDLWRLAPLIAGELLLGYVVGYCASLPLIGMQLGGQIMDQQMGVSAGGVFNPELDAEMGVAGQVLFMSGLAIFLVVGGHHAILLTLIGSFEAIPIGMFVAPPEAPGSLGTGVSIHDGVHLVLGLLTVAFDMALRIAAPMLCILFLLRVAMGFIGRTVPQMNILSVGFIFYILVGLMIWIVGAGTGLIVFRDTMVETLQQMKAIFTM
jgi:flagellar biosynthetic protein FliR